MEPTEPPRGTKRPLPAYDASAGDDDGADLAPSGERKPRFPKGKKAKYRDPGPAAPASGGEGGASAAPGSSGDGGATVVKDIDSLMNPELAAVRRARSRKEREDTQVPAADVRGFEVRYEEGVNFVDDGIRLEPFNLEREREEGYFDENGNFVEYARGNEIKDAWLDSVEIDTKFAEKVQKNKEKEEEFQDLSSDDIGKIKRRIANMLEPGETIIQALKRLKSTSSDKRGKMTEGTKRIFDELTEAAMKLMENGEYNVYSDDRETFEREAEGYERLARARLGMSEVEEDIFADTTEDNQTTSSLLEMDPGPSAANASTTTATDNDDDTNFDMFGDNDDGADVNGGPEPVVQDASGTSCSEKTDNGNVDSDYVYDTSSGYYYSSSTGYYYDPTSGCYCSASTGTWYSYDQESGTYNEMKGEQTGMDKEIQGDGVAE